MHVKLRLRSELPNILKSCNASGLMVTHDPEEAMSICDKVAVMNEGRIHQIDSPLKLLENPKTLFVSSFIIGNNILNLKRIDNSYSSCLGEIKASSLRDKKDIKFISISPKSIFIERSNEGDAIILSKEFLGEYFIYKVSINKELIRIRSSVNNVLNIGDKCIIKLKMKAFIFYIQSTKNIYLTNLTNSNCTCPLQFEHFFFYISFLFTKNLLVNINSE